MYTWREATQEYVLTGGAGGADGSSMDIQVTLPAAGWTGSAAPYQQTVTIPQMREDMTPFHFFAGDDDTERYAYTGLPGRLCTDDFLRRRSARG